MQKVMSVWTEIRNYEFPDDAPVHNMEALFEYVQNHPKAKGSWKYFYQNTQQLAPVYIPEMNGLMNLQK